MLRDAWPALVALVGVPISGAISYVFLAPKAEVVVAFAGVILQWGGLAFIAWSILGRRKDFGRQWFRRLLGALRKPRNITVEVGLGGAAAIGAAGAVGVGASASSND